MSTVNSVMMTEKDLRNHLESAQALIEKTEMNVSLASANRRGSYVGSTRVKDETSLTALIRGINPNDTLLTDTELHTLRAVRRGIQVGYHIAEQYRQRAGVADFRTAHALSDSQTREFNEKMQTAAAVAVFSLASFILWDMERLTESNAFIGNIAVSVSEMDLSTPTPAIKCMLYHLCKAVERETNASDERLVAVITAYAEAVIGEIHLRMGSLKHQESFLGVVYQLEETDFTVDGFKTIELSARGAVAVKRVERDEIIGNSEATTPLFGAVAKLCLYDVKAQMNPVVALGRFPSVFGLDGDPGNGKTLLMSGAATYFSDIATAMGLPHKVMVVPSFVDKYQGISEKEAAKWCAEFRDPRKVTLGIGDEFEQVVPDHGDEDSSEGNKGVATAFLKAFDGVSTIVIGNTIFVWATNYIEIIDKAWLSRTNGRAYVGGAETLDDYVRFIVIMLRKVNENFPGLINFTGIDWNMDVRAPQVPDTETVTVDPSASVLDIYDFAKRTHDENDVKFLAKFFWLMKRRFKAFSLRDCKNAIEAVTARIADFEVPQEFVQDAARYTDLPFEEKQGLVSELAREHVRASGADFVSLLNERARYFAHEALRVAEIKHRRAVEERKSLLLVDRDARGELGLAV